MIKLALISGLKKISHSSSGRLNGNGKGAQINIASVYIYCIAHTIL